MIKAAAIFAVLFILFLIFVPGSYQSCDTPIGKFKSIEVHEESRESLDLSGSDETSKDSSIDQPIDPTLLNVEVRR